MDDAKTYRILIVDDSYTMRSIIKKEISQGGYEILEAENGSEALKIISSQQVDLITLDVEMPVMNGYEVCKQLYSDEFLENLPVQSNKDIPIILLTSLDSIEERQNGFEIGSGNYIQKPFLPGELLTAVERMLRPPKLFKGLKVLIADDSKAIRKIIYRILKTYEVDILEAENGEAALNIFNSEEQIDLVITDLEMPNLDGEGLCKSIRGGKKNNSVPIIFLSAIKHTQHIVKMFNAGANDYLMKPFSNEELSARINTHLSNVLLERELYEKNKILEEKVKQRTKELSSTQDATIFSLATLAEYRDPETGAHIVRTKCYIKELAEQLKKMGHYKNQLDDEAIELLVKSAPLHDIGKVGVPDNILQKKGKLTDEEYAIMKKHVTNGRNTILAAEKTMHADSSFMRYAREIAYSHHEKWDGTGYPDGLKGEEIPLSARLMALADVYDALISERCYKPPFSHEKSVGIILEGKGTYFDPIVVEAFLEIADEFENINTASKDFKALTQKYS